MVAHAVSVMVLQVGAVRHGLRKTAEDREALQASSGPGARRWREMRRLLVAMRRDGDGAQLGPQPGLDDLGALLEEIGRSGLPVQLQVEGERHALPRAVDLPPTGSCRKG